DGLVFIPSQHPRSDEIVALLSGLAETLPKYQDEEGLWWQVLDKIGKEKNYQEASVTAMFMYSFAKAANRGYISQSYKTVAEKTLTGMQKKLLKKEADGTLTLIQC